MSDTNVDANKALVLQFNEDVFNKHNPEAVPQFVSTDLFNHVTGASGAEDFQRIVRKVLSVAPDSRSDVDLVVAEGDTVVLFVTWSGTHRGEVALAGRRLLPTGVRFAVTHVHRYRVLDGKITDHFAVRDDLGLLRQLEDAKG